MGRARGASDKARARAGDGCPMGGGTVRYLNCQGSTGYCHRRRDCCLAGCSLLRAPAVFVERARSNVGGTFGSGPGRSSKPNGDWSPSPPRAPSLSFVRRRVTSRHVATRPRIGAAPAFRIGFLQRCLDHPSIAVEDNQPSAADSDRFKPTIGDHFIGTRSPDA